VKTKQQQGKTREDLLRAAAMIRLNFERQTPHAGAFRMVYESVLRDYELSDQEVTDFLATHREELLAMIEREGDS